MDVSDIRHSSGKDSAVVVRRLVAIILTGY